MSEVISKTIKIKTEKMPPCSAFIEQQIIKAGLEPLRWAIVEVDKDELVLNISGRKLY